MTREEVEKKISKKMLEIANLVRAFHDEHGIDDDYFSSCIFTSEKNIRISINDSHWEHEDCCINKTFEKGGESDDATR